MIRRTEDEVKENGIICSTDRTCRCIVPWGGVSGVDEVLAKTIRTKVTVGEPVLAGEEITKVGLDYLGSQLGLDLDWETVTEVEFKEGDSLYLLVISNKDVLAETAECAIYKLQETEIEVPDDDGDDISNKVVSTVDPQKAEQERKEAEQKRREEAALQEQKATEQKVEDFETEITSQIEQIRNAAKDHTSSAATDSAVANTTVVIKTDYFTCFTTKMMELLAANPDVSYEIHYRYRGKNYVLTIPAGADWSRLEDANGYYGFRYLDSIFGGYEVEAE